ncbi:putative membrane protein [Ereboglobus sp. PH5-10]|uniref:DUF2339 domain-containing protein n=1 Tax=Ereboglobus sp. PH5-10 TaxID=2940629 RepID=UPI0024051136|nr:DUF2339 domain-containing protein [Ereboglobus sp. PH5-10]MDF9827716.1 putative membrane protein [Ereboglobus sp. PH5-10]
MQISKLPEARPKVVAPPPRIVASAPPPIPGGQKPAQPVVSAAPPQIPPTTSPQEQPPNHSFNWEVFMGTKFLSWLGAVAAFLAVAFFLKYSIDRGLIPPIVRAAMGFVFGAGLVAGGLFAVRKTYPILGHALCAAGIVSLYGVTFACRALYHFPFFGVVPTFALMSLITAAAFTLAVRLRGKFIAILGLLGGFATPAMLSTGVDNPLGLFGYIALLNIGLYSVALHRRWNFLVVLGVIGTVCMQVGWAVKFLGDHNTLTAMIVCLVFDALFLAGYCAARRMGRETATHGRGVAAMVFVSLCFALYLGVDTVAAWRPWWLLGFVFLADACAMAVAALDRRAKDSVWLPAVAGIAVFVVLAAWTPVSVNPHSGLLPWALGAYFVFAVLHTAFPLILARVRPELNRAAGGLAAQFFAPLALLLVIMPVLRDPNVHWLVWPAILLIDFVAIICAAMTRSLGSIAASLVLTLATAAVWVCKIPVTMAGIPVPVLLVTGGFAILFFAASLWLGRRIGGAEKMGSGFTLALPALSSLLPFVLVVMMLARITLVDPTPVFGLGLVLTVMTLGLAKLLKNEWLPACALAGVLAICWTWFQDAHKMAVVFDAVRMIGKPPPANAYVGLGWFAGFYAIFAVFPFAFRGCFSNTRGPWLTAAAAGVLFFPLVYWMIKLWWPNDVMGIVPAMFALPALTSLTAVLRYDPPGHPRRMGRLALFGGVTLLFVTLIFPIQFSREWVTIAWALEGAALFWLYTRVPHRALPWAGAALLAVAFVRLALNPAVLGYHVRGDVPVLNWYLYTYGIAIACMFGGAWLLKRAGTQNDFTYVTVKILPALGAVLAFLLLNIEIADFFTAPGSHVLTLEFSGNFARDMSYTIAWALFALALLVAGIWRRQRVSRYAALGLLAIVAVKLVFHDLDKLDTLYRVGALFAVAIVMILASFLYQKYIAPREGGKTSTPPQPPSES